MTDTRCHALPSPHKPAPMAREPLFGRLRAWMSRRRNLKELLSLDDRTLRDIGLTRRALARHYRRRHFWW